MLKHRMSCIPIHISDYSTMDITKYRLELKVENKSNTIMDITSKDIKLYDTRINAYITDSERDTIFPKNKLTDDYILITRLYPRKNSTSDYESIDLESTLSLQNTSISSVYNTTSSCAYSFVIDPVKQKKAWDEYKKNIQGDIEFEKKNWYVHEGKRHFKENHYKFILETVGVYTNEEIVKKACISLKKKLDVISSLLETKTLDIKRGNTIETSFDIVIPNDNYTIGKIIEFALYSLYFKERSILSFVGYNKVHPHVDYGVIRVMFHKEEHDENYIYNMLPQAITSLKNLYSKIQNEI